jgi:hypothetical protein
MDGTSEEAGHLAYGLRTLAFGWGLEQVEITIADVMLLRDDLGGEDVRRRMQVLSGRASAR